jgi:hypothetical protein
VEVGHTVADQGIRRDLLEVVAVGHTGLVEVRQAEHHILEADADQAEHRNPGVAAVHSLAAAVGRSPEVVVGRSLGEARHIGRVVRRSRQVPG